MPDLMGDLTRKGPLWAWQRLDQALLALVNSTQCSEARTRELKEALRAISLEEGK